MKEGGFKRSGEDAGRTMPGSGAGVALGEGVAGCVGVSGVCRKLAPVPPPPHIPSDTPFPGPLGRAPPLSPTLSSVPREGRLVSCLSPSPCQFRTNWGSGSSPAPNSQGQGSHLWADVTAGLQPDPESVFIPAP